MLAEGSRLGPYEIADRLGAGGMGEVYRAIDTRLGRTVAIKVLPSRLADDPTLKKRLLREARAISTLSHSNICSLHDIGSEGDVDYLVMEHIEGETLASRLKRGPLPVGEALVHALSIASALDHAHREKVVHRDLKPSNVMLTRSGAKLLDFGLARLSETTGESLAEPLTSEASVVGTIEYMAPEQLSGDPIDARTDIFSFGVLLYEMLSATRPFGGTTRVSVISGILLSSPPSLSDVVPDIPPGLERLIFACLEKKPDDRVQTAHDLHRELGWIADGTLTAAPKRRARRRLRLIAQWTGAVAALVLLAATAVRLAPSLVTADGRQITFTLTAPRASDEIEDAILSPDSSKIVFVTRDRQNKGSLWLRELSSPVARPLPGTENAYQPFWSPDSRSIGFFASDALYVMDLTATRPRLVVDTTGAPRGASWSADGTIVVAPHVSSPLMRVSSAGGTLVPLFPLRPGDTTHRWPQFLPDGRRFLFVANHADPEQSGLFVATLGNTETRRIADIQSRVAVVEPGWLFSVRDGDLFRQRFDLQKAELAGQPVLVAENVSSDLKVTGLVGFSATADTLLYLRKPSRETRLIWRDRAGSALGFLGSAANYVNPHLSPDGTQLAVAKINPLTGRNTLWTINTITGSEARLVVDDHDADGPIWSHDGRSVFFSSNRRGPYEIYEKPVARSAPERLIFPSQNYAQVTSSRPGLKLLHISDPVTRGNIWLWRDGESAPRPLIASPFAEAQCDLSPDGRWVAFYRYDPNTGVAELIVQSVADARVKVQIASGGSSQPTWSRDGRELFYLRNDKQLMVLRFDPDGENIATPLFPIPVTDLYYASRDYVPHPDGKRIVVLEPVAAGERAEATVVAGWASSQ